jgi:predicted transcriptional regulator
LKLKFLNILFQTPNDFLGEIDKALKSGKGFNKKEENILIFDSVKAFNNFMTVNKIQILRAISQVGPESVYRLASILGREPQHVLKDCRHLEAYKFIRLEESSRGRNPIRPVLTFDYDVIKADSSIISPYIISERSEKLLTHQPSVV